MPRPNTAENRKPGRPRFGVYLTTDQLDWINQARGRYLIATGRDVRATTILRLAIDELRKKEFAQLKAMLDRYRVH